MIDRLYSLEQVREFFPENHRPSVKILVHKAKEAGCCIKVGRGIGLTEDQVKALFEYLTCPDVRHIRRDRPIGTSVERPQGTSYLKAREQLIARKRRDAAAGKLAKP